MNTTPFIPDIIIAGAPKCGTTSVFEWLSAHPSITGSNRKETYFLMDHDSPLIDHENNAHDHGMSGYKAFFPNLVKGSLTLEATPDYLYQKSAPFYLSEADKMPSVIFILRDPAERAYSAYRFFTGNKSIVDRPVSFAEFIELIYTDSDTSDHKLWPIVKNTLSYGKYINYIKYWDSYIGKQNRQVFLYEDLKESPMNFMRKLAISIGIDDNFYTNFTFESHNKSYSVRSIQVHRLKTQIARLLPNNKFKSVLGDIYKAINVSKPTQNKGDNTDAILQLKDYYSPYNKELQKYLNMDLSPWV